MDEKRREEVGRIVDRVLVEDEFREWRGDEKSHAFLREEIGASAEAILRRATQPVSQGSKRGPALEDARADLHAAAEVVASSEKTTRRRARYARALQWGLLVLLILGAAGWIRSDSTPLGLSTAVAVAFLAGTAVVVAGLNVLVLRRVDRVLAGRRADVRLEVGMDRLQDLVRSLERSTQDELEEVVRERLREALAPGKRYATRVRRLHAPGLAELRVHRFLVGTKSTRTLRSLIERMPGGSIGVSGPRGAGKTTLLERTCDGRLATDDGDQADPLLFRGPTGLDALGIKASAPVKFDSRDFLLHLTSLVCWAVLDTSPGAREEFRARMTRPDAISLFSRPIMLGGMGLVVLGAGVALTPFISSTSLDPSIVLGGVLAAVGYVTALGATMINRRRRVAQRRLHAELERETESEREGDEALRQDAGQLLERIKFQQTYSSGWSGGLKFPVGIEGKMDMARSVATLQMSLPEVASELEDLLRRLTARRIVVIGIDELDKMASRDEAYEFLNEIKVVFGLTGCFFLLSVSEEALGSFERRGMPFRDVFDSAFDEIVYVPYLTLEESSRLLAKRVIGLPEQFVALCHCLGGGLPRDVIRSARDLANYTISETTEGDPSSHAAATPERGTPSATTNGGATGPPATPPSRGSVLLADAAARLVRDEIEARVRGALIALRDVKLEPELSSVLAWARSMPSEQPDAETLLARCEAFRGSLGCELKSKEHTDETAAAERRALLAIAVEVLTYGYYAATILEYFDERLDKSKFQSFDDDLGDHPAQLLAEARQAFSVSPRIAWDRVSAARTNAGLPDRGFPELGETDVVALGSSSSDASAP